MAFMVACIPQFKYKKDLSSVFCCNRISIRRKIKLTLKYHLRKRTGWLQSKHVFQAKGIRKDSIKQSEQFHLSTARKKSNNLMYFISLFPRDLFASSKVYGTVVIAVYEHIFIHIIPLFIDYIDMCNCLFFTFRISNAFQL